MDNTGTIANGVLGPAGSYRMLRFTRIATANTSRLAECSTYMARQVLRLEDMAGSALGRVPLPNHGIVFVPQDVLGPAQQAKAALEGGAKWLRYEPVAGEAPAWRRMGDTQLVDVDWQADNCPRVIVRQPMVEAVLVDTRRPHVQASACTYYSLRRVVRALVDNRVCGGRLNFGPQTTAADTRSLMAEFLGAVLAGVLASDGTPTQCLDDRIGPEALKLRAVLRHFFPDDAPTSDNSPPRLTQADVMYGLWQSTVQEFIKNTTRASFPIDYVGRGAPGALAYVGLVTLVYNPVGGPTPVGDARPLQQACGQPPCHGARAGDAHAGLAVREHVRSDPHP